MLKKYYVPEKIILKFLSMVQQPHKNTAPIVSIKLTAMVHATHWRRKVIDSNHKIFQHQFSTLLITVDDENKVVLDLQKVVEPYFDTRSREYYKNICLDLGLNTHRSGFSKDNDFRIKHKSETFSDKVNYYTFTLKSGFPIRSITMKAYSQFLATQLLEIFTNVRKPDIAAVAKSDLNDILPGKKYLNIMDYTVTEPYKEKSFTFGFKSNSPFLLISIKAGNAMDAFDILKSNARYADNHCKGFVIDDLYDTRERKGV